ncbi:MAG: hypothetical protein V4753_09000 [Pseudomonadota bacterium]
MVDVDNGWSYPDEATTGRGPELSGVAAWAKGLVGSEAVDDAHRAMLAPFRQPDGSFRIGASCRFLVARA